MIKKIKIVVFIFIMIIFTVGCGESYHRHQSCVTAVRACEDLDDVIYNERMECFNSAFTNVCKVLPDEPLIQTGRKEKDVN